MNDQTLFRLLPVPAAAVDAGLIVREVSAALAQRLGAPPEALAGLRLQDVLEGVEHGAAAGVATEALGEGAPRARAVVWADPAGRAARFTLHVMPDGAGGALVCLVPAAEQATHDQAERVEQLSAALRGIKHEINNPLTGALGNINMLLRREDWDEKTRRRLTTAEQEMKKIGQIVVRLAELVPPGR